MCLSVAYKNKVGSEYVVMKNVASFAVNGDQIVLKDLMEKTLSVKATVQEANLLDGTIVLKTPEEQDV